MAGNWRAPRGFTRREFLRFIPATGLALGFLPGTSILAKGRPSHPKGRRRRRALAPNENYTTSWLGNTFSGADNKWVQDYIDEMEVSPDGAVYTAAAWDEAGRCCGVYKDGDVNSKLIQQYNGQGGHTAWGWGTAGESVAIDDQKIYLINTSGELVTFDRANLSYLSTHQIGEAVGATVKGSELYVVRQDGTIDIYDKVTLDHLHSFQVDGARDLAIDDQGNIWVLAGDQIQGYNYDGNPLGMQIPDPGRPRALSIDHVGRLVVADNGPRQQVLFYELYPQPRLVQTFGDEGGLASGRPGEVTPSKLFNLAGAGTDSQGNLYVGLSGGLWDGTIIRKYGTQGDLQWEVMGLHFLDLVAVDPRSDGAHVYGAEEHYILDLDAPPGREWKLKGYTLDPIAQADDPRASSEDVTVHVAFARRVNNQLLLFMNAQLNSPIYVYRPKPHTEFFTLAYTYERQLDGWGTFADSQGAIWESGSNKVARTPIVGWDDQGNPVYGTPMVWEVPTPYEVVQWVNYIPETDTLYVAGYTPDKQEETWGIIGKVMSRFDSWLAGNRTPTWTIDVPHDFREDADPRVIIKSAYVEGDFIFMHGVFTAGRVWIYKAEDGTFFQYLVPGDTVGGPGPIGWGDMVNSINAYRRRNGEYLVFVEEDYRAKVLMYRWRPHYS